MADAALDSLLEYLQQLQLYRANSIGAAQNLVKKLENDLRFFQVFVKDTTKKLTQDKSRKEIVRKIRDVVYEVEDVINAVTTQATDSNSEQYFLRAFETSKVLLSISEQVDSICGKIRDIYGEETGIDSVSLSVGDDGAEVSEAPLVRRVNVVGFEDEAEKLIGYLTEETPQLDVLTIIGVAGLGKTTLAGKIFCDPAIKYEFPTRIWVYVSQQFTNKDIFLSILREFVRLTEDIYSKSNQELATLVASHLDTRKFLIVMDDVWKPEDWDKLQIAFPKSNKMGKVLITSRYKEVAEFANPGRRPHELRFLTLEESSLLFRLEVFGKPECPSELKDVGELIAGQCHELPLAILVVGGMLVEKLSASNEMSARTKAWIEVSEILDAYRSEKPLKLLEQTISLSYDKLPYHLRECFLYLGIFPEDYEIPVWKLICMWIAEGFIQQKDGKCLEETAQNYLEDLVVRNLVRIDKTNTNGEVKTCRIHDMIRDFCKTEAGYDKENFLQEMTKTSDGVFEPPDSDVKKYRRLCVHSDVDTLDLLSSKPYGPHIRSFVCFSKDEINLPPQNISVIPKAFKLLRVLEAKPIKFTKVPSSLYQLIHLKYIFLSFNLSILPTAFSKLWNIQTLIVDTTSNTLEVRADIWKMIQLRHFKTNASATLLNTGSKEGEKLQTLGAISPQSCTKEVLNRVCNLKKLSIRGRLTLLLDGKNGSFDSLGKLVNLEKLKLLNGEFYSMAEGQLPNLPPPYKFPPKLRSLTLSNTFLDWSHISILGLLENLKVLKLKDNAFVGKCWVTADGGFLRLEVFHIGSTNLVTWIAYGFHFPRLRHLELQNCEELLEIPTGLADIPSLEVLDLYRTTSSAAAFAKKIHEAKRKKQAEQTSEERVFKLCIFPPHE